MTTLSMNIVSPNTPHGESLPTPLRSAVKPRVTRRGNTLVLVAGILVLLVIIATSYLATTQTQRNTSVAQQAAAQREDNSEVIAEMVAQELADALFVWPVDWDDPALYDNLGNVVGVADANFPRKRPAPDAVRYGFDEDFPYNFAPYHTVPFTNWLDWAYGIDWDAQYNPRRLPAGPGNLFFDANGQAGDGGDFDPNSGSIGAGNPAIAALLSTEYNPLGNPGFGDSRWLRDTEPVRWDTGQFAQGFTPGELDAFSHWRKLTNIARANNGWRIVWDISDVDNHIMTDLNVPVEQWLASRPRTTTQLNNPAPFNAATGTINATNALFGGNPASTTNMFWLQWRAWFNASLPPVDLGYEHTYINLPNLPYSLGAPPNLYKLNDLNGNGVAHDYIINGIRQDTPQAEFIPGTARHTVGRVLTDTTGDGRTDSFWFLSPAPARNGIRQVIGVSIVDNSARLNANVATRFWQNDPSGAAWHNRKSKGITPADLALVGQMIPNPPANGAHANVGLYDNPDNWADVAVNDGVNFNANYRWTNANNLSWQRHLSETGLPFAGWNVLPVNQPLSQLDRLDYWQFAGRLGLGYHPDTGYRPFGLSDELELRMFEGHNHPWIYSRFEFTVQAEIADDGLLRANRDYVESSEYLGQRNNRELVRDLRSKLTLYSGARNDQSDPSLWWFPRYKVAPAYVQTLAATPQGGIDPQVWENRVYDNFRSHSRLKLDLREPVDQYHGYSASGQPMYDLSGYDLRNAGRLNMSDRLAGSLLLALTDGPDELRGGVAYGSYFGRYNVGTASSDNILDPFTGDTVSVFHEAADGPLNRTRRLAAAYAANILAYRSNLPVELADAVLLPAFGYPGVLNDININSANYIDQGKLTPTSTNDIAYLGMEPQPFVVEVFLAHVYKPSDQFVPKWHVKDAEAMNELLDPLGIDWDCGSFDDLLADPDIDNDTKNSIRALLDPYANVGQRIVYDHPDFRSTIIAVQIANPFDVPLDLHQYQISLFGQQLDLDTLPLSQRWLPPATDDRPVTAIFYGMKSEIGNGTTGTDQLDAHDKWLDFLDLNTTFPGIAGGNDKLAAGTIVYRVPDGVWSTRNRHRYDNREAQTDLFDDTACGQASEDHEALVISRRDEQTGTWVVVDRIDPPTSHPSNSFRGFRGAVNEMCRYRPVTPMDNLCEVKPYQEGDDFYFPTYDINDGDHWIQWVRATRAWGVDANGNGLYENHERNPRYVFGDRAVIVPTDAGTPNNPATLENGFVHAIERPGDVGTPPPPVPNPNKAGGNAYTFADPPNDEPDQPRHPWFARSYYTADGHLVDGTNPTGAGQIPIRARKPMFFTMNWVEPRVLNAVDGRYAGDPGWVDGVRTYPDKGWYGQFAVDLAGLQTDQFAVMGIGWSRNDTGIGGPLLNISGVDHPTVIFDEMAFLDSSYTVSWTRPRTPLFRQPFAMQMAMKNKMSLDHFGDPPTFPGWYNLLSAAAQSELLLDRDFEQIGELLNVWLFGHEVEFDSAGVYLRTRTTFAEFMSADNADLTGLPEDFDDAGDDHYLSYERWLREGQAHKVNRLHLKPLDRIDEDGEVEIYLGHVLNRPILFDSTDPAQLEAYREDKRHAWPAVPAGARVLDLFVCDGPGRWLAGLTDDEIEQRRFYNANDFVGRMTPGLININTATPEVMRAMPHMTRIVSESFDLSENPFPKVAEAIVRYRDRVGAPVEPNSFNQLPIDIGPPYAHRGRYQGFFAEFDDNLNRQFVPGMRGDRGFASLGELGLLTESGRQARNTVTGSGADEFFYDNLSPEPLDGFLEIDWNSSWRIDYPTMPDRRHYELDQPNASTNPYAFLFRGNPDYVPGWWPSGALSPWSARISTATSDTFDPQFDEVGYPEGLRPDWIAEDNHEANLLLAGISNLVTTRSDTFTVHLRIRSFRQNPVTGVWDATDPEYIVDDTRYVMLVDRSNVNRPSDKPKIMFLERLPK